MRYGPVVVNEAGAAPPGLTEQQTRLLEFLRAYIKAKGYPPSVRECLPSGPWRSPSGVAYQLKVLTEKGWIRRGPGPRMITIVDGEDTEDQRG